VTGVEAIERAISAIDVANAEDPHRHGGEPLALAQGRLADGWVVRLDPQASAALRLAARAHHLRRWVVPRATYPEGRAGYLRWRRDQKQRHAVELREILERSEVDAPIVERAVEIVAKIGLGSDPEVQVFEDAVCLTFLETQLGETAERLDAALMTDVIVKTLAKMSPEGKAAASMIDLDDRGRELLAGAVDQHPPTS
jgi:hypothetical protein